MPPLIHLDTQQGIADNSPVVHAPAVAAVAVRSVKRPIMDKLGEVAIQIETHLEIHARLRSQLLVLWKLIAKARCTVAIVVQITTPRIWPVNTVRASKAADMRLALVCLALSTHATAFNDASLAAAVHHTLVGLASSTLAAAHKKDDHHVAAHNDAAFAAAVLLALVCLAFSTLGTAFNCLQLVARRDPLGGHVGTNSSRRSRRT
jgi:hypothetical protein